MEVIPERLAKLVDTFSTIKDRSERLNLLIAYVDRFREVPPSIATRPFPEENRLQGCESDAFVWAIPRDDGTLDFHFAIDNSQGMSGKAMTAIFRETLSGAPLEDIARMPVDLAHHFFGNELPIPIRLGIVAMIQLLKTYAKRRMAAQ